MRGLLYRDMKCVVYRTFWMFLYFIIMDLIVTLLFKMANTDEAFKIYPVLMTGMGALFFIMIQIIPGEIMKTEEKKEWKYYLISTGMGVEKIVAERYLMTFLINFATYVFAYLLMIIFFQLADSSTTALIFSLANGVYICLLGLNLLI